MTHEEREALIERMAAVAWGDVKTVPFSQIANSLRQIYIDRARRALDVAEQAIREDERKWLAQRHDESAAVSSDPNIRSLHKQMAGELRARGTQ